MMLDLYRPNSSNQLAGRRGRSLFDALFDFDVPSLSTDFFEKTLDVATKVEENSNIYAIDVPGVKREDISIDVTGRVVSLEWSRDVFGSKKAGSKRFTIPDGLDESSISAKLEDGVLYLTIGRLKKEGRKVEIN